MDINPKSYHLTAFELINQLPYINFPTLNVDFLKDLKSTLSSSVAFDFVTSVLAMLSRLLGLRILLYNTNSLSKAITFFYQRQSIFDQ